MIALASGDLASFTRYQRAICALWIAKSALLEFLPSQDVQEQMAEAAAYRRSVIAYRPRAGFETWLPYWTAIVAGLDVFIASCRVLVASPGSRRRVHEQHNEVPELPRDDQPGHADLARSARRELSLIFPDRGAPTRIDSGLAHEVVQRRLPRIGVTRSTGRLGHQVRAFRLSSTARPSCSGPTVQGWPCRR